MTARLATKGRQTEDASHGTHKAGDMLRRNALQIEITANRAVGVFPMIYGDDLRAKATFTLGATPRNEADSAV